MLNVLAQRVLTTVIVASSCFVPQPWDQGACGRTRPLGSWPREPQPISPLCVWGGPFRRSAVTNEAPAEHLYVRAAPVSRLEVF